MKKSYKIDEPKKVILDIDSTGIQTFGKQENKEKKYTIKTIRNKFLKIVSRCIKNYRYFTYKLASSYPYKETFYKILENIRTIPAV